jgi:hypothetical protein
MRTYQLNEPRNQSDLPVHQCEKLLKCDCGTVFVGVLGMRCTICNQAARHADLVEHLHHIGEALNETLVNKL